jgi:DNA processing protein
MNNLDNYLKANKQKNLSYQFFDESAYKEKFYQILENKINILTMYDENYPKSFFHVDENPEILYLYGNDIRFNKKYLAVVGSREPRNSSVSWLENHLGRVLKDLGLVVVSGGARGVDQIGHAISLRSSQNTIVVLPSGINQPYPMSIEKRDQMVELGALFITEYEPEVKMQKHHFIKRNRLISALAQATLIVEAKLKGGTMITARYAADQGRPVFVVPFHPSDINGLGNLRLIQDGASMVIDSADLSLMLNIELKFF